MSIPAVNHASRGIQQNLATFERAAMRIANNPFNINTIRDISDLQLSKHGMQANVAVLKVANKMTGTLVDLFA